MYIVDGGLRSHIQVGNGDCFERLSAGTWITTLGNKFLFFLFGIFLKEIIPYLKISIPLCEILIFFSCLENAYFLFSSNAHIWAIPFLSRHHMCWLVSLPSSKVHQLGNFPFFSTLGCFNFLKPNTQCVRGYFVVWVLWCLSHLDVANRGLDWNEGHFELKTSFTNSQVVFIPKAYRTLTSELPHRKLVATVICRKEVKMSL